MALDVLPGDDAVLARALDSLVVRVCVLDAEGLILATNRAWNAYDPSGQGVPPWGGEGSNYLAACDASIASSFAQTARLAESVRLVIGGAEALQTVQCGALDGTKPAPFVARIIRYAGEGPGRAVVVHQDITSHTRRDDELARFHAAMDASADAIYQVHRPSMRFLYANEAACALAGCTRSELMDKGPAALLRMPRERLERVYDSVIEAGAAAEPIELDGIHPGTGKRLVMEIRRRPLQTPDGWVIVTVSRDVTARKVAEQSRQSAALRQGLLSRFGQKALSDVQLDDLFTDAASVAAEGLATPYVEISRRDPDSGQLMLLAGKGWQAGWLGRSFSGAEDDTPSAEVLRSDAPVRLEGGTDNPRIRACPLLSDHDVTAGLAVPIPGPEGASGVLGVYVKRAREFSDEHVDFLRSIANILSTVIARKAAEQRLTQLAQYDALTGLPNRSLFLDRLTHGLIQAQRLGWRVGVLFIDLDGFKGVNDSLGHDAGDELLRQASARLNTCVRASDTVGRLGGDEFAVLLPNVSWPDDAAVVAQRVVDAMSRVFVIGSEKVHVSASVGIAVYPDDAGTPDSLLKGADTAMYQVKEQGRRGYRFYQPQMDAEANERAALAADLRGALERNEFLLHYQPKAEIATGRICGFEALLRWNHPRRGLVPPLQFIGLLEESGLIDPVGEWVIAEACRQIRHWQIDGIEPRPVAINLSARQFQRADLDRTIVGLVARAGVDPSLIEFELTESLLMADAEQAAQALGRLKAAGFRLSLDDFGTGYSSLAYLKRFPLDTLKIDRMFMRDVTADADGASIALAIINLAHSLKMNVVAEGVETRAQLDFLKANGCDAMQGYLLSRPMPAADCSRMLIEGRQL